MSQGADRVVDSELPLIKCVIRRGRAGAPPSLMDRCGEFWWRVEHRIAGGRTRGHRRLDVTQRKVCASDVGADSGEQGSEVVVAATTQDPGPLPDSRMDQQVSTRL